MQKMLVLVLLNIAMFTYSMHEPGTSPNSENKKFNKHVSNQLVNLDWQDATAIQVKALIVCNADPNSTSAKIIDTPLINACYFDRLGEDKILARVTVLIKAGADPKKEGSLQKTPLHWAAYRGLSKVVEYLIEQGAVVNCKDAMDNTPLNYALLEKKSEVVRLLHKHGAILEAECWRDRYDEYIGVKEWGD